MTHKTSIKPLLLAVMAAHSAMLGTAAAQAQTLEEVLVTAQKRAESLQDVPISVAAMSGERVRNFNIQRFEELSVYVPNFSVSKQAIGDTINIRGIQSGNQAGFEQSVGTFVDGVYRGRGTQIRNAFMDVAMVEVLRGPQGTLFGKNTVAGALNIRTNGPTDEFESTLTAMYTDEFDETEFQGFVSGPLTDTLRGRVVLLNREKDEGHIFNAAYNEDQPQTDETYGRVTLAWDATDRTTATFRYEAGDFDINNTQAVKVAGGLSALGAVEGYDRTSIGNFGPVMGQSGPELYEGDNAETSLTVESEFDAGSLTVIAAYSEYDFERFGDVDAVPIDNLRFDDTEDYEQASLEVRWDSTWGDKVDYIVGAYAQSQELTADGLTYFNLPQLGGILNGACQGALGPAYDLIFQPGDAVATATGVAALGGPAALGSACGQAAAFFGVTDGVNRYANLEQDTDTWAVFGQGTYRFSDSLALTLGLRYTEEEKDADQSVWAADYVKRNTAQSTNPLTIALAQAVGEFTTHDFRSGDPGMSRDEEDLTWSANLQWEPNDWSMFYASASTGFKAGGFNSFYMGLARGAGASSEDVQFGDEEVITYEIGGKTTLLDGAAELNFAIFRTEYDDLQVSVFSGNTTFNVQNAAEATSQGFELDGRWAVTEQLTLQGSVGYIDFEFDEFPNQACTAAQFAGSREAAYQAQAGDPLQQALIALGYNNAACAAAGVNDLEGESSAHTPEWTANLSASYRIPLGSYDLNLIANASYSDEAYRQDDLDPVLLDDDRWVYDATVLFGPADGGWDLSVIGRNLSDEEGFSWGNDVPLFGGSYLWSPNAPRSVAVRGRLHF